MFTTLITGGAGPFGRHPAKGQSAQHLPLWFRYITAALSHLHALVPRMPRTDSYSR